MGFKARFSAEEKNLLAVMDPGETYTRKELHASANTDDATLSKSVLSDTLGQLSERGAVDKSGQRGDATWARSDD